MLRASTDITPLFSDKNYQFFGRHLRHTKFFDSLSRTDSEESDIQMSPVRTVSNMAAITCAVGPESLTISGLGWGVHLLEHILFHIIFLLRLCSALRNGPFLSNRHILIRHQLAHCLSYLFSFPPSNGVTTLRGDGLVLNGCARSKNAKES